MSSEAGASPRPCPCCGGLAAFVATRPSRSTDTTFVLDRCARCAFVFVREPRTDFERLYDARYYAGLGADPTVDYAAEMNDPATVRVYEWRGILRAVEHLELVSEKTRWLDYGCGLGGLVRYVRAQRGCDATGFEDGYAGECLDAARIARVRREDLVGERAMFDVVTAIEVLEHAIDPVAELAEIASLLRPGGLLFLTTGNAEPFRDRLTRWSYAAVPDVHVSLFTPSCLAASLRRAGLEPATPGPLPGLDDIIRYKILKGVHVNRRNRLERGVPWSLATRIVDGRYRISAMPLVSRKFRPTETTR